MNGDQSGQPSRRVVVLVSPLPPPIGGLTVWTTDFLESARSHGLVVKLINTSPGGDRVEASSRVRVARVGQMFATLREFWAELEGAEVVHISTTWYWSLVRDGMVGWIARLRHVPVVMQIHAATNVVDSVSALSGWKLFAIRVWLRPVDVLAVLSRDLQLAMAVALPNRRVDLVPNWVNIDRFYPHDRVAGDRVANQVVDDQTGSDRSTFPGSTSAGSTSPGSTAALLKVIFVGRLMKEKGFIELAKAAIETPSVSLLCVGDRPEGLGDADRATIDQLVEELRATGRFSWVTSLSRDAIASSFRKAEVFVLPSWNEGLPISLLEAMASGLPCVITPVGAMGDLLEESSEAPFAFVVPVDDRRALAGALALLAGDPEMGQRMGANGRRLVEAKFSTDVVMIQILRMYESLSLKGPRFDETPRE